MRGGRAEHARTTARGKDPRLAARSQQRTRPTAS
jgi:hypothetical protein